MKHLDARSSAFSAGQRSLDRQARPLRSRRQGHVRRDGRAPGRPEVPVLTQIRQAAAAARVDLQVLVPVGVGGKVSRRFRQFIEQIEKLTAF